jgi:hypothetical protein
MWQVTCTQVNQGNSQLLVVRSQIHTLIPSLSFDHNLCFKSSNGTCEPILDIKVLRDFQWYNEPFNPMSFDPYNLSLKIQESIKILIPQWVVCEFIPSRPPTFPGA